MNKKVCVIIEGQLRGSENCGPTIKKYLVDFLNADLYFYVQNYEHHLDKNFDFYGECIKKIIYDNPTPDFEDTFNKLSLSKNIDQNKWKENFHFFKDDNYKLGYSSNKPGTCIRRMYNRHLIYEKFKDSDYEWFVILRSDMYFYKNFQNILEFSSENLYTYKLGKHMGLNNNLIVFHKKIIKQVLNYIDLFLDASLITYVMENNIKKSLNEERFFDLVLKTSNTCNIDLDDISCFISGNLNDTFTTWQKLKRVENYVYKYEYDFSEFCKNTNQTHLLKLKKENNNLHIQKEQKSINQENNNLHIQKEQKSIRQKKYDYVIVDDQKDIDSDIIKYKQLHDDKINNLNNNNKKFIFFKNDTNKINLEKKSQIKNNNLIYMKKSDYSKKNLNQHILNNISENDKLIYKLIYNK